LWDVTSGKEIRRLSLSTTISAVAFASNGSTFLTGGSDGSVRLWYRDPHEAVTALCAVLLRDFSSGERALYSITDNAATCPSPEAAKE
jgi:WD40 repeat protein